MRVDVDLDDLDRILISDEPVTPSARFAAGVMEAIAAEAAEPPPLPFPWGRFAAGVAACAATAASGVWFIQLGGLSSLDASFATLAAVRTELGYAIAAVFVSLATLRLQQRHVWDD